jgi:membrane protein
MIKVKRILKKILAITKKEEMNVLPGEIAFFLVLSIVPTIALIGFILSQFSLSVDSLVNFMKQSFPKEAYEIFVPMISGKGIDANVITFMIFGFLIASNGPYSIIVASNMLYGFKADDYLKQRIKAVFMTILLVMLFTVISFLIGFSGLIFKTILSLDILENFTKQIYYILLVIKLPISFIIVFFLVKMLYTMAPDTPIPSKYVNNGALFTTIGWSLVTIIYSYYVENFTNYDIFYGGLSNIIIMMMWIYILSYILVMGIVVNTTSYENELKKDE